MITVFRTMLTALLRDMHTVVLTILFPLALFLGLGLYFDSTAYSERLLSGVLAMQVLFGSTMVTAFYVMAHRNRGIYKLLRITPFSTLSYIGAMTASRAVLSLLVNLCLIISGIVVLHINLSVTSILAILFILLIGAVCFTAVGFIAANLSRDESNVNMISNVMSFPMLLMSGAFYSLEHAPAWIKILSKLHPFSYFVDAISQAAGASGSTLSPGPVVALSAFSLLLMVIAAATFRWDSERLTKRRLI